LATLDFGACVEQPFGYLIIQNCQAVQSVGRSMDWTLEADMVDGLFFCTTLTGRRVYCIDSNRMLSENILRQNYAIGFCFLSADVSRQM